MEKHVLSKSTFLLGDRCHKALYLNKYHNKLKNKMTDKKRHMFETGKKVGILAHELFPGGELVQSIGNFQKGVLYTKDLIENGIEIIYEAAIQHDGVLVLIDILVKDGNGWKIYEVKSSTGMKDQYVNDAAIQYYVATKAGLEVDDISIVYIDNQYVRLGEIDVESLFTIESVRELVLEAQEYIEGTVPNLKKVLKLPEIPAIDIGEYCNDPYECDFTGYCWRHIPDQSIFDLVGLNKPKNFNLYRSGVLSLDQIPDEYPNSDKQRIQIESYKSQSIYIDHESIQSFLHELHYPLYFMDFETYSPAIPIYENSRPYQAIPFQYSLHVKENEQAELKHHEFLGMPQEDPRQQFINRLLSDIGNEGTIIVYHKSFEKGILEALIEIFPEHEKEIQSIIDRIIDLMIPFQKMHYYTSDMRGSYSIKEVLPAVVPDLDYGDLEVSDGISAMITFERLLDETDEEVINKTRLNLLEYCKRDTLAMVRILEILRDT
jgi:predicted RecB family nuclease